MFMSSRNGRDEMLKAQHSVRVELRGIQIEHFAERWRIPREARQHTANARLATFFQDCRIMLREEVAKD
jgi:hypothetical protein